MNAEKKPEKREKLIGYVLLIIGLAFIIVPALMALVLFATGAQVPQFVPIPSGSTDFASAFATFSNVCLIFFIFIAAIWAGSIITSRGVTMIKDVKLKLVGKSLREAAETAEKVHRER